MLRLRKIPSAHSKVLKAHGFQAFFTTLPRFPSSSASKKLLSLWQRSDISRLRWSSCPAFYIGETDGQFSIRIQKHVVEVSSTSPFWKSAFAERITTTGHTFNPPDHLNPFWRLSEETHRLRDAQNYLLKNEFENFWYVSLPSSHFKRRVYPLPPYMTLFSGKISRSLDLESSETPLPIYIREYIHLPPSVPPFWDLEKFRSFLLCIDYRTWKNFYFSNQT